MNVNDTWSVFYTTFAKFSGRIFYTKNNGYLAVIVHLSGVFHLRTQLIDALNESWTVKLGAAYLITLSARKRTSGGIVMPS